MPTATLLLNVFIYLLIDFVCCIYRLKVNSGKGAMLAMAGGLTEASKAALEQAGWILLTEYPKIGTWPSFQLPNWDSSLPVCCMSQVRPTNNFYICLAVKIVLVCIRIAGTASTSRRTSLAHICVSMHGTTPSLIRWLLNNIANWISVVPQSRICLLTCNHYTLLLDNLCWLRPYVAGQRRWAF